MSTKPKTFIIAEAGVNHNGSLDLALKLVDAAADSGADAVKFQTFQASQLVSAFAPRAEYQIQNTKTVESQLEMIRRLELSERDHFTVIEHCRHRGIEFLSTPFDFPSLELLTTRFGLKTIKVSSGDIDNAPFLLEIGRRAERVILSTGMCHLTDVEEALGVLAFALTEPSDVKPGRQAFRQAFASQLGQKAIKNRVQVLHCTTEYPAPPNEVNLRAMDTIANAFGVEVGYSDHTRGIHISLAAVARGAVVLEKHFTLDRSLPGPDHKASLEPQELKELVAGAREIELALGDGIKRPTSSEAKNRVVARRSLVAACEIAEGDLFSTENMICKRPGSGISPMDYWNQLGRKAPRKFQIDEVID